MNGYTDYELKPILIDFYKEQYLKFLKIGVNNETEFGVTVTKKLLVSTENRLDQLIKGVKTRHNVSDIEKGIAIHWGGKTPLAGLTNSNRSFLGYVKSKFQLKDLEPAQQFSVYSYTDYNCYPCDEPQYIDEVTTAYNSETMRAILSHDN